MPKTIRMVRSNVKRLVLAVLAFLVVIGLNSPVLAQVTPSPVTSDQTPTQSREGLGRQQIRGGWYPWDPYQYLEGSNVRRELTGLDVRLLREAFEGELGRILELSQVSWKQHQREIRDGLRDVAGGAFRTAAREKYAYYSKPYRYEEVVVYRRRFEPIGTLALQNNNTLQQELNSGSGKIGLVRGYHYGDAMAAFAADPDHSSRIVWADDHEANLLTLLNGKVQLAPVDRLVGATIAWRNKWTVDLVSSTFTVFRGSIHVLFSKRTTDPALVKRFDDAIEAMQNDGRYDRIVQHYLFPVLLALTVGQDWFYMLEIVGTVAFAISGILIAQRDDFSLFGAFVLALLPAVGGGIIRDLIINRDMTAVLRSPISLLVVIGLVLLSALLIRVLPKIGKLPRNLQIEPIVDVLDAVALAAYTVVGVIVAIETRCEPLLLWGPLLSALTVAGGSILRDVVRGDANHPTLRHALYAEIAMVWGLGLAAFLNIYAKADTYDPVQLQTAILLTMLGVLVTRLVVIGKRIRSPRFR